MKYVETGTNYYHSVGYEYDQLNNLTSLVETINGTDYTTSYVYDDDNRVTSVTTDEAIKIYSYDDYGRSYQQRTTDSNSSLMRLDTFTFKNPSETTTSPQIIGHTIASQQFSKSYSYTYDDNGNILSVNDGTYTTSYLYDSANQLIRENNEQLGFTYVWAYDSAGNILSRTEYAYAAGSLTDVTPVDTITYTYGNSEWGDLLTAYDGTAITYDEIGNPLSDGTRSYTWEHGRELSSLTQNNVTWNYTYDSNGMRTSRTNGSESYKYIYSGDLLSQLIFEGQEQVTITFAYDAHGRPMTATVGTTIYYYITNLQGDVIGIMDDDGIQVAWYSYDAWGRVTSSGTDPIQVFNPLLYRGYVYDQETELYYLQSRYYDPALGRFINADGLVSTGQGVLGNNMFAYCLNNPVVCSDRSGEASVWAIVLSVIINAVVNVGITFLAAKVTGQDYTWWDVLVMAIAGAANSIPHVGPLIDGIISGVYAGYTSYQNGASTEKAIIAGVFTGVCSMMSIGNMIKYCGTTVEAITEIVVNLVFGLGSNLLSSGVSKGITDGTDTPNDTDRAPYDWKYDGNTPYCPEYSFDKR